MTESGANPIAADALSPRGLRCCVCGRVAASAGEPRDVCYPQWPPIECYQRGYERISVALRDASAELDDARDGLAEAAEALRDEGAISLSRIAYSRANEAEAASVTARVALAGGSIEDASKTPKSHP